MNRTRLNLWLLTIFLGLVVVYPAWHQAHCADPVHPSGACSQEESSIPPDGRQPNHHDSDQCPVCHIALASLLTNSLPSVPVPVLPKSGQKLLFHDQTLFAVAYFVLPFLRGPPA